MSLDGVSEDPTGDDGFRRGGWFLRITDRDLEEWAKLNTEQALRSAALLMGRRSDAYFAPRWLAREGAWAERLNAMPKYVVSSTLEEARWTNATIVRGDVVEQVTKLKEQIDGEILLIASRGLVQTLLEHDLVDEVRLIVYPCVVGAGERLFGETSEMKSLRLLESRVVGDSLTHLAYEVVR